MVDCDAVVVDATPEIRDVAACVVPVGGAPVWDIWGVAACVATVGGAAIRDIRRWWAVTSTPRAKTLRQMSNKRRPVFMRGVGLSLFMSACFCAKCSARQLALTEVCGDARVVIGLRVSSLCSEWTTDTFVKFER